MKKTLYFVVFLFVALPISVFAETADYDGNNIFGSLIDTAGKTFNLDSYSIIAILAIVIILVAIIIAYIVIKKALYNPSKSRNFLSSVSNRKIKAIDPTLNPDEFKKFVSEAFKTTADAFSNFRYDILRENFSEKLYNEKIFELDSYKKRNLRNILSNITPLYCQINKVQIINDVETVDVIFTAQFKDYIVAEADSDVIMSGSKRDTQERTYLISFTKKESNSVCPKCGGEVQNDRCLYCRFEHAIKEERWFMDKMKILKQKTIGK